MIVSRIVLAAVLSVASSRFPGWGSRVFAPPNAFTSQDARAEATESDDVIAVRKRANQGDSKAPRRLGDLYKMGLGVNQDHAQALGWYRKAADRGDPFALGTVYAEGEGVRQDYTQALAWYEKAANQGDAAAASEIGSLYYYGGSIFRIGEGMPKDYAQAVLWFQRAADQGDALGQYGLGAMYLTGQGVSRNLVQAHKWLSLGGSRGPENAKEVFRAGIKEVESAMTPQQITEAKTRASSWLADFQKRSSAPLPGR